MNVMRLGGGLTLVAMLALLTAMGLRERRRRSSERALTRASIVNLNEPTTSP